ncbi:hypothetical protein F5887DRAFT_1285905 [Amanita rubescens]|nr:hypothetical protein F5887DRAFT_1285905 [Amanita rubescens]
MRRNSSNAAPSTTEPVVSIRDIIQPEQQKTIQKLLADKNGSDSLLELAKQSLSTLSHWDRSDRLLPAPFGTAEEVSHIDSFQLLETMLECASLGGPQHYVAAAIVSCQEELSRYIRLANTWFGLFLWQFRPTERDASLDITTEMTPAIDQDQKVYDMKYNVAARDDHKCAISGIFDIGYWRTCPVAGDLTCAHILKRGAGTHEGQTDNNSVSLFDILLHLFPNAAMKLNNLWDTPANWITLSKGVENAFHGFFLSLVPYHKDSPQPNTYKVVKFPDTFSYFNSV